MSGFYEEKGMTRYGMVIPADTKEKLDSVAKTYGLSQGDVVQVLIEEMNAEALHDIFNAKRESKVDGRKTRTDFQRKLSKSVNKLTPEQIAVLNETIVKMSTGEAK